MSEPHRHHCRPPEDSKDGDVWSCDCGFEYVAKNFGPNLVWSMKYQIPDLVLTESVMTHMLADLDQIVTEMEMNPGQFSRLEWVAKLRRAVDGEDYKL